MCINTVKTQNLKKQLKSSRGMSDSTEHPKIRRPGVKDTQKLIKI